MSGFAPAWLDLREPLDTVARATELTVALGDLRSVTGVLRVLDLGTGSGANLRYLAPRLGGVQAWTVVDHDPALLAILPERTRAWARQQGYRWLEAGPHFTLDAPRFRCTVTVLAVDLTAELAALPIDLMHLVTASALLDLVSQAWLQHLLQRCRTARTRVLFALTYDGCIAWHPTDPDDALVHELIDRHQRTDKGFGPALGPRACAAAQGMLTGLGYGVREARSPWHVRPQHTDLQVALHRDWHQAARALAPAAANRLDDWLARRLAHVHAGRSRLRVGHRDLVAWPA